MTVHFRYLIIAAGICFVQALGAQELMTSRQSLLERQQVINDLRPDEERRIAGEFARRNNLPERMVYKDGTILEIRRISSNGHPMYYKTTNKNSAETISSDEVREGGAAGLELDGSGIVVGVWDGGTVRITHDEFEARARILDGSNDYIDHATHVAGTIGAAGIRSNAHGMAHKSIIDSYDWDNDNDEMSSAAGNGLLISNHSYGFVHGWEYDSDLSRWEWHGDAGISEKEEYGFGYYGVDARIWDDIARDHRREDADAGHRVPGPDVRGGRGDRRARRCRVAVAARARRECGLRRHREIARGF